MAKIDHLAYITLRPLIEDRNSEDYRIANEIIHCLTNICEITNRFHDCLDLYIALSSEVRSLNASRRDSMNKLMNPRSTSNCNEISQHEFHKQLESLNARIFQLSAWQRIPAKTAALEVYDIYQVSQALNSFVASSEFIRTTIDREQRRAARNIFENSFPDFKNIRNVVAHYGEFYSTKQKIDDHAIKDMGNEKFTVKGSGKLSIVGMIEIIEDGCIFSSSLNGSLVQSELSVRTAKALEDYCWHYIRALSSVISDPWQQKS